MKVFKRFLFYFDENTKKEYFCMIKKILRQLDFHGHPCHEEYDISNKCLLTVDSGEKNLYVR